MLFLTGMTEAANDDDTFWTIGLHAALVLNKFKNLVETNGLGDAGPVDEVSKDDEERGGRNPEARIDRESEHPRRASA
jgi:hypothetical protein